MEFSSGMCIGGALGVNTVESGGKKQGKEGRNRVRQREGSVWITGQMTLADPMGVWSGDGPSGLS